MNIEEKHGVLKRYVDGFDENGCQFECQCGNIDPLVDFLSYQYDSRTGKATGWAKLNCRDCGSQYTAKL